MRPIALIGLLGASACLWMLVLCLSILSGAVELEEAGLLPVVGEAREIVLRNTGGSETSPENP